jgi:ATP-binding cassette subfamily B protein
VVARIGRNDRRAYAIAWVQWVLFHLAPVPIGLALKVILDRVAIDGRPAWDALAVLAGLEAARWALLISAAVQWHGAYIGWLTVPRSNAMRSLVLDPGPTAGRLPSSPGEAVSRFRDDAQDLGMVLDSTLDVSGSIAAAVIAVAIMATIEPVAALGVVVPVGAAIIIAWRLGPRLRRWRRDAREATASVTAFIGDTFGSVLAVKAAGAEAAVERRFSALNLARARVAHRDQVGSEVIRSLGYGTGEVTVGFMLLVVAAGFRRGELSVGDIGLFASYVPVVAGVPKWLGRLGALQRQADVSVDRLAELLQPVDRLAVGAPALTHLRSGPPAWSPEPSPLPPFEELRVEARTVRHPGSGRGIEDVDLVVRRGEFVVVTGEVGAGKTTLLRSILGLLGADLGEVGWNGVTVADPAHHLVPPRVAYLPQVPRLFSESLRDTVLLGLPDDDLAVSLWLACFDHDLKRLPEGVETLVGARGVRLSGGQVQRAGAARALVRRPELLVVDDLSSALDVATEMLVWERVLSSGLLSALVVSNRPHVLRRADRVLHLVEGRVSR